MTGHRAPTPVERWLRLLPFALVLGLVGFVMMVAPISIDSGGFIYEGRLLLRGRTPYLDGWDHKGTLLYFANTLALALTGDSPRGVLVVEAALTALALWWTTRRWAARIGERETAIIATALVLAYGMFWSSGNLSETWFFPVQLVGFTALLDVIRDDRAPPRRLVIAGVLVGLAGGVGLASRMNNVLGLAVASGCFVLWRRGRATGFVAAAFATIAVVIVPVLLFLRSRGALEAMWDQYWLFNTRYNTISVPRETRIHNARFLLLLFVRSPLMLVTAGAALLWLRRFTPERRASAPLLVLGSAIIALEFAAQLVSGQGFRHYLVSALPGLATLAVLFRIHGDRDSIWPAHPAMHAVAYAIVLLYAASTWRALEAIGVRAFQASSVGSAPLALVAAEVAARAPAGAPILGSGNAGAVLAVTGRASSSRYFNDYPLLVPGYGPPKVAEFARELEANPPAVIVRTPGSCEILTPAPECMPASRVIAAHAEGRFERTRVAGEYEVWVRISPRSDPALPVDASAPRRPPPR